ncbi:DUF1269 domain-containing protein [Falsiroseomonas selenitidurans]|uniref:DUF1269 domain-containing protein n=1 Tax=Falsiroseomonas selenitidurans TaxID=2716335 RepID=A0ABX1EDI2_9PROT|nr:DUF1269 domain-containing protein [Falsiroseomonas selenitidurans]NKC33592.1 DUF1269 domain-containing protein [Falsiroseomonas selenitidurans]
MSMIAEPRLKSVAPKPSVKDAVDHARAAAQELHGALSDAAATVHGTAVVHRDDRGRFEVDTKETHPVFATAVGVGIGALLGVLGGPVGIAVGAAAGAAIGGSIDLDRSDVREAAADDAGLVIARGQSAVIADVSEEGIEAIGERMRNLGGTVHRRSKSSLEVEASLDRGFYPYEDYLYPYEYVPSRYAFYYPR